MQQSAPFNFSDLHERHILSMALRDFPVPNFTKIGP